MLREQWVVLDLVDSGYDGCSGQELVEVLDAVIGDSDGFHFACYEEFFHIQVRVHVVAGQIRVAVTFEGCRHHRMVSCYAVLDLGFGLSTNRLRCPIRRRRPYHLDSEPLANASNKDQHSPNLLEWA